MGVFVLQVLQNWYRLSRLPRNSLMLKGGTQQTKMQDSLEALLRSFTGKSMIDKI